MWIWAGDNIYGDIYAGIKPLPFPHGKFAPGPPDRLRRLYAEQLRNMDYSRFLNSSVPMLATWDDHDFGLDNGDGHTYPYRDESQAAFLDFIGEPPESPRRRQRGVYTSQLVDFGAMGELGRKVLVVLLDMRYSKDPYGVPDGDFLGEAQWEWLDRTLAQSEADVHLIVSSLQLLQSRNVVGESWVRFPAARKRLLSLLARRNVSAPIVLSGDVHFAELGMGHCSGGQLLEVTSSGMTHSIGTKSGCRPNPVTDFAAARGFELAMRVMPWRYQLADAGTGAPQYYAGTNFGELEFDWPSRSVGVRIFGEGGALQLSQAFLLDDLGIGRAGALGAEDFGPLGGEPSALRVGLGVAICASVPLLMMLLCIAASWRLGRRALRLARASRSDCSDSEGQDSQSEASESGSESGDDQEARAQARPLRRG